MRSHARMHHLLRAGADGSGSCPDARRARVIGFIRHARRLLSGSTTARRTLDTRGRIRPRVGSRFQALGLGICRASGSGRLAQVSRAVRAADRPRRNRRDAERTLARVGHGRGRRWLLSAEAVHLPHEQEDRERDDEEVDDRADEDPVVEGRRLGRLRSVTVPSSFGAAGPAFAASQCRAASAWQARSASSASSADRDYRGVRQDASATRTACSNWTRVKGLLSRRTPGISTPWWPRMSSV